MNTDQLEEKKRLLEYYQNKVTDFQALSKEKRKECNDALKHYTTCIATLKQEIEDLEASKSLYSSYNVSDSTVENPETYSGTFSSNLKYLAPDLLFFIFLYLDFSKSSIK